MPSHGSLSKANKSRGMHGCQKQYREVKVGPVTKKFGHLRPHKGPRLDNRKKYEKLMKERYRE